MSKFNSNPSKSQDITQNRSVTVFAGNKGFDNPQAELNFAKDYNKRAQVGKNSPKKRVANSGNQRPASSDVGPKEVKNEFESRERENIAKQVMDDQYNVRVKAHYTHNNPLKSENETQNGDGFKPSCKRNAMSDLTTFNFDDKKFSESQTKTNKEEILGRFAEKDWKSSVKKVETKESKSVYEDQRRQLKDVDLMKNPEYKRNPLTEGDLKSIYAPTKIRKEAPISSEYQYVMDRKYFLPHERHSPKKTKDVDAIQNLREAAADKLSNKNSGSQARDLIQFNYSTPYDMEKNRKVNEINIEEKFYRKESESQSNFGKKSRAFNKQTKC